MTIRDYSILEINKKNKDLKYRIRGKFKKDVEELFDHGLNEDNSSLMKSIVLGEYRYMEDEDIAKYRELGLAHILAVSGLHIGIIVTFLVFILSNLGIKRRKVYLLTFSIIWFYGFLIGFPPSLLRANIMMTILFLGKSLAEPYDSLNSLFLSMFILLIINPFYIMNLGFQLSYMAAGSIIYLTPKIQEIFYPYRGNIVSILSGILGVQIGLLAIQAYYFNEIPLVGILTNLVIAPILSLALILSSAMIGVFYLMPGLNKFLSLVLDLILNFQFNLVEIFHKFPLGRIWTHSPSLIEIIIYYFILLVLFKIIDLKKLRPNIKRLVVYCLVFYIIVTSIEIISDKSLEIHFIDVGQGDSILIKNKKGNYLIDTGGNMLASFDIGKNITLPYLRKHGVRSLNGVFISHFHDDHCKGLPLLIDNLKIDNIFISYRNTDSPAYNHIIEKNLPLTILGEGDKLYLDENLSMEVLSPNDDFINRKLEENDLSLVLLLKYYNRQILFTGDMEKEVEDYLLDKIHEPIDIIKVPHHGSNTSSTKELLEVIRPKYGVITVGRNNLYGHPREEVLDRYRHMDSRIYRTDLMGMVKVELDREKIRINSFIREDKALYSLIRDNISIFIFYMIYYLTWYILVREYNLTEEEELN